MLTREQEDEISTKAQLLAGAVIDNANNGRLFRDIAALLAMQGLVATKMYPNPAVVAFDIADAMAAERNKRG